MALPHGGDFGTLLRYHRSRAGMTQRALADKTFVSQRAIGYLEKNRTRPRSETVRLLADALTLSGQERTQFEAMARGWRIMPQQASGEPKGNLPQSLTSFVGRAEAIGAIAGLLRDEPPRRMVTLTGPGGSGKTRLALEVAQSLADEYPDGIWLIPLETWTEPQRIAQAVADALDLREQKEQSLLTTIARWLRDKNLLLVLDNCEHLLDASALLAHHLLQATRDVQILATSRIPLRIGGEMVWRVPSLTLPTLDPHPSVEEVAQSEAVQLLLERANANNPGFTLTADNAATVAHLCLRLDGLPLALELAAAQLPAISAEGLVAHFGDTLQVLAEGSQTVLPRHQTLRATLDWSYDLLAQSERALLRRLAIFVGGFTAEAAERVCSSPELPATTIIALLAQLVHKSLVQAEDVPGGEKRYRLLEIIRQFGQRQLEAHGEYEHYRQRHWAYYTSLAESVAFPLASGQSGREWMRRLIIEAANIEAALRWAEEHAPVGGLRLAGAAWVIWYMREMQVTGRNWLNRFLVLPATPPDLRARALYGMGMLSLLDDINTTRVSLAEALTLAERSGDLRLQVSCRFLLTYTHLTNGEMEAAEVLLQHDWEAAGPEYRSHIWMMYGLRNLMQGNLREAHSDLTTALSAATESRQPLIRCLLLNWLGEVSRKLGEFDRSAAEHHEAAVVANELGFLFYRLLVAVRQGQLLQMRGELARAEEIYQESLELALRQGENALTEFTCYRGLGEIALYRGNYTQALEYLADAAERAARDNDLRKSRELAYLQGLARWHSTAGRGRAAAAQLLAEGLRLWQASRDQVGLVRYMESLALLASTSGYADLAAAWLSNSETNRARLTAPRAPIDESGFLTAKTNARAVLGDERFAAAWRAGEDLALEEAVAQALTCLDQISEQCR